MKSITIITLLTALLSLSFYVYEPVNTGKDLSEILIKEYKKTMKKKDIVGMSLGVYDRSQGNYTQNFGFEDLETNKKTTADTQYKIGSISKVFTAIAVLKLHENGVLDINRSIKEYIPEIELNSRFKAGNELIIRDILCHSAGLPSDLLNGMFSPSPASFSWVTDKLKHQYMSAPAKDHMSYSNLGYGMLGELISRVSNKTYTDYMNEEIFDKLDMHSSYVFNGEESLSKAYVEGELFNPDRIRDQAAGSVVSSINDMMRFISLLANSGQLDGTTFLSEASVKLLEKNHLENNAIDFGTKYSFGLFLNPVSLKHADNKEQDDLYINHGGDTYAFHADFGYLKEAGVGTVILTNSKRGRAVCSASNLLSIYLAHEKNIELEKVYDQSQSLIESKQKPMLDEELKGSYTMANLLFEIEDPKKIRLDFDGQKVIMKRKGNTNAYKVTPILFGIIPWPIKSIEMVFHKEGDRILITQSEVESKRRQVVGVKLTEKTMDESWTNRAGKWRVTDGEKASVSYMDFSETTCELSIQDDCLKLNFEKGGVFDVVYFTVVDRKHAYNIGIGRNTGNSLTVDEEGQLHFVGIEMEKVD